MNGTGAIETRELAGLFAGLERSRGIALAVSGGGDSMALLHLFHLWQLHNGLDAPVHVLTVDHGLRRQAQLECAFVVEAAHARGLPAHVLPWEGRRVKSGVQAAARAARYRLMTAHMVAHGLSDLLSAHHREDQAETMLMRLMRGSSAGGLAAMEARRAHGPITVRRPFLSISKERLMATLARDRIDWVTDPSNDDRTYERVRARRVFAELDKAALGEMGACEAFAKSATRLARAGQALDEIAVRHRQRTAPVRLGGFVREPAAAFLDTSPEILIRCLQALLHAIGGKAPMAQLSRIEALAAALGDARKARSSLVRTLSGCRIALRGDHLTLTREAGRKGLERVVLAPGTQAIWDRRFRITAAADLPRPVIIAALGAPAPAEIAARLPAGIPRAARETLAAAWDGDEPVAIFPQNVCTGAIGARLKGVQIIADPTCA